VVLISLLVNPALKPFWFQFGFMRWIVLFYSFFWILSAVWNDEFELRLLKYWNVFLIVVGFYALLQCLTGIDIIRPGFQKVQFNEWGVYKETGYFAMKATAFFSLSLTFAYVLGPSLFAASGPSFENKKIPKLLSWSAVAASIGGIFSTMSRGAWISLLIGGVVAAWQRCRRLLLGAAALGLIGFLALFFAHQGFHDRLMGLRLDHSSTTRFDVWRGYAQMFLEHPFFGIGLLQGDILLPDYYTQLGIKQEFVSHAHNVYLQWAAGAGVFALLIYLWIIAGFLKMSWKLRTVSPWGWSLTLAQLFVHIGAFTECNFFDAEVLHMLVFLWAVTLTLYHKTWPKVSAL
jgi:O-antigen ligase